MPPASLPAFVAYTHPILADRIVCDTKPRRGERFHAYLLRIAFSSRYVCNVFVNGRKQTRRDLQRLLLQPQDRIGVVPVLPAGGDGSDPFQIILTLAIIVAASYFAPAFAKHFGIDEALARGILGVGGLVIASFIIGPPKLPRAADAPDQAYDEIFSVTGGSNPKNPYGPGIVVLGKHRLFPAFGAEPYTQYLNQDQYLYMIFHWGFGDLEISDRKIATTDLDNFAGVTREFKKGGRLSIVADDIFSIEGAYDLEVDDVVIRETPDDVTGIAIDFVFALYRINDKGDFVETTALLKIEVKHPGNPNFSEIETFTQRGSTTELIRRTRHYTFSRKGAREIKITRLMQVDDDYGYREASIQRKVSASLIKCTQETTDNTYELESREALVIQATGQLNNVVDNYYGEVRQLIPTKIGGTWTAYNALQNDPRISNPAAILRFVLKGLFTQSNVRIFGAGMDDADIHYASLDAWFDFCEREQLEFNYVQTVNESLGDVIRRICTAGRASPQFFGTKLGVIFDNENDQPKTLYSADNILQGTFQANYNTETIADSVVASFINAANDYATDELRVTRSDVASPQTPVDVRLEGITDEAQARRAANLTIAENEYHNLNYTFETDAQGLLSSRGDVVLLAKPRLSQAGRFADVSIDGCIVTFDRSLFITPSTRLTVRGSDGKLETEAFLSYDVEQREGTLPALSALAAILKTAKAAGRIDSLNYFVYDDADPQRVRITEIDFKRDNIVRLTARPFIDAYYQSKDRLALAPTASTTTTLQINDIEWTETYLYSNGAYRRVIRVILDTNRPILEALIYNALSGALLKTIRHTNVFSFDIPADIRRSFTVNIVIPTLATTTLTIPYNANPLTPPAPTNLTILDCTDCIRVDVDYDAPVDFLGFEFRYAVSATVVPWERMARAHRGYITATPVDLNVYVAGVLQIAVRVVNRAELRSEVVNVQTLLSFGLRQPIRRINMRENNWVGFFAGMFKDFTPNRLLATSVLKWSDMARWDSAAMWVSKVAVWNGRQLASGSRGVAFQTNVFEVDRDVILDINTVGLIGDIEPTFYYRHVRADKRTASPAEAHTPGAIISFSSTFPFLAIVIAFEFAATTDVSDPGIGVGNLIIDLYEV